MIVIGFDMQRQCIRILQDTAGDEEKKVKEIFYTERIFSDLFFAEMGAELRAYFKENRGKAEKERNVCVVLPDETVGFETFRIPNMQRVRMQQAFETELQNLYGDRLKTQKVNRFVLAKSKQYTVYGVYYFDKHITSELYRVLAECRLTPRVATYEGNALLNFVYESSFRLRGKSFLFADVREDCTVISVSSKGRTLGVAKIPHGLSLLNPAQLESEYMRVNHDAGEIAVINAREIARARSLTLSEADSEAASAEERQAYAPSQGSPDEPSALSENAAQTDAETERWNASAAEEAPRENSVSSEREEETEEEQRSVQLRPGKVFHKTPKRYPKFMTREMPETEEGFLFENFRILAKWLLLYGQQAVRSDYIASPEYILVHLPERYRFLLDKMNEEADENSLKFRAFTVADRLSDKFQNYLDLIGGKFAKQFNKHSNF